MATEMSPDRDDGGGRDESSGQGIDDGGEVKIQPKICESALCTMASSSYEVGVISVRKQSVRRCAYPYMQAKPKK